MRASEKRISQVQVYHTIKWLQHDLVKKKKLMLQKQNREMHLQVGWRVKESEGQLTMFLCAFFSPNFLFHSLQFEMIVVWLHDVLFFCVYQTYRPIFRLLLLYDNLLFRPLTGFRLALDLSHGHCIAFLSHFLHYSILSSFIWSPISHNTVFSFSLQILQLQRYVIFVVIFTHLIHDCLRLPAYKFDILLL